MIEPGDFADNDFRLIYTTICRLRDEGTPADMLTICNALDRAGFAGKKGVVHVTASAIEATPNAYHIRYYAEIVKAASEKRHIRQLALQVARDASDPMSDPNELATRLWEGANGIESKSKLPKFITSRQLSEETKDVQFLIQGVLVADQPCVIAGEKKALKTTTIIDLTISLATGLPFLGRFPVISPVKVGMMSGESGQSTIKETANRICDSKDIQLRDVDNVSWAFGLPKLNDALVVQAVERFVEQNELKVLLIDPAYLCLGIGDTASNYFGVGERLECLSDVAGRTGCVFAIITHNRKPQKERKYKMPDLEDIAYSGFPEWAGQWILLARREEYDPEKAGEHKLWLNIGSRAGFGSGWAFDVSEGTILDACGRRWEHRLLCPSEVIHERKDARAAARRRDDEEKFEWALKAFRRNPDGLSVNKLKEEIPKIGGPGVGFSKALQYAEELERRGKIESAQVPIRGGKTTTSGFRFIPDDG